MRLKTCRNCASHFLASDRNCPHCGIVRLTSSRNFAVSTALLGLCLSGCGDQGSKIEDSVDTEEPAEEDLDTAVDILDSGVEPPYGVGELDSDNDGFYSDDDCDDSDPFAFPGAAENESATECHRDADEDGYGDSTTNGDVTPGGDCDDSDATIHPAATDIPDDGIDQNCDGEQ